MNGPTLLTERLRLRALRNEDFEAYAAMHADAEVMRFITGAPMSREDAWRHFAMLIGHWTLRGFGMWAVEELATGAFVGRIGFHQPEGWPDFELGWALAREFQGRGYATEAARSALAYGFLHMGREHVISMIHRENTRSMAVAYRLGEVPEGETVIRGIPVIVFGIHRERWLA